MDENKNEEMNDEELDIITLIDEDGVETDYEILGSINEDGADYVAVVEAGVLDEPGDQDIDYLVLKYATDENGEDILVTIDDDAEFDKIADIFDDFFSSYEYEDEE